MANNRLILCEVDDDGKIVKELVIAKNMGGPWYTTDYNGEEEYLSQIDEFFANAFINGNGISIKDEYMEVPLPPLYVYNDPYEGKGEWKFHKEKAEKQ